MTKEQLQQELKKKITPGVKPSQLKKSKSESDLPNTPKSPTLKSSHSTTYIPLIEPTELEDKISILELKLETKDRELADKEETIKDFRKALQKADEKIKQTQTELDNSLLARQQAVKQFGQLAEKLKQVRKELEENVEQASTELINQDEQISRYRANQLKAQNRITELEQDLQLSQRMTELRSNFLPTPESNY